MGASDKKRLMQEIFSGLASGDSRLFVESMADDFRWTMTGTTSWSRTYDGKQAVLDELLKPLRAHFDGRIKTVPEVCESEHLKARGMISALTHPSAGPITVMGVPIKLHATPGEVKTAPPTLGQHTGEVLKQLLGLDSAAIERLRSDGTV